MSIDASDPRPQQLHIGSRCRRFAPALVAERSEAGAPGFEVAGARPGYLPLHLNRQAYRLACLFDGERRAEQIIALAAEQSDLRLTSGQLEGFAAELSQAGVLLPGVEEPLPVPAYTEFEMSELGWTGDAPGRAGRPLDAAPLPPSSVPGSRGNPGLPDGLNGLSFDRRRGAGQIIRPLPTQLLVRVGSCFNWPLATRWTLVLAMLLSLVAVAGIYAHRLELAGYATALWENGWRTLLVEIGIAAYLVNLVSSAARVHAIAAYSPERPRCGVALGFLNIPRLVVESSGVVERAGRRERLRIVGSSLLASQLLFVLAAFCWLMTATTAPRLAQLLVLLMAVAAMSWVLRVNPLANRDGYALLTNWLSVTDLREQAWITLFGAERPWSNQARKLPRWALAGYAMLCAVFVLGMTAVTLSHTGHLLDARFGGLGFMLFLGVTGAYMFRQFNKDRITELRGNLGWSKTWLDWRPTRRDKIAAAIVLLLCCFPYRFEPSGELVVQPHARADVRALVPGDVREVLVTEGDTLKAGQLIARLRDDEQRARVAQSEAELARLQADLSLLNKGAKAEELDVARQRVATSRKKAEVSRGEAQRAKQAFERHGITGYEYDRLRGAADVDEQQVLEAQRALDLIASPALADLIAAKEAQIDGAKATVEYNRQQLADTEIKAPLSGRIVSSSLMFALGKFLNRGDLLAVIEDTSELRAEIKLPESSIGEIKVGSRAAAKIWAYPGTTFDGSVSSVAPSAEGAPYGNVVRVQMTLQDPEGRLRPEMTGSAKAQGDRHLAIVVFTRALTRFLFVEVWSWLP